MNSGHVTERVCVHVCTSGSSKRDFVLLELLTLVVSTNTTIYLPSFNGLRCKLAKVALFIYIMCYWVECMTSSVISFAYIAHFSNLNI